MKYQHTLNNPSSGKFRAFEHPSTGRIFWQWAREGFRILRLAVATRRRAHFLAAARHAAGVVSQLGRFLK
jgi:hypothetical protein